MLDPLSQQNSEKATAKVSEFGSPLRALPTFVVPQVTFYGARVNDGDYGVVVVDGGGGGDIHEIGICHA